MEIGVISDGISRNFKYSVSVIKEYNIKHVELQYIDKKEVGDLTKKEQIEVKKIINNNGLKVPCVSRHNFSGLSVLETKITDKKYINQLDSLKRCIEFAKFINCPNVRVMSFKKEMILFGENGAEQWIMSKNAWKKLVYLFKPIIKVAEKSKINLVVETGNNAMINSAQLALKLIKELSSRNLKVLWDPANSLFCNEKPYPDGLQSIINKHLGHIHMKDLEVDIPQAKVKMCQFGKGEMNKYMKLISKELHTRNWKGVVSFESVYHPGNKNFEHGFRNSFKTFKKIFQS